MLTLRWEKAPCLLDENDCCGIGVFVESMIDTVGSFQSCSCCLTSVPSCLSRLVDRLHFGDASCEPSLENVHNDAAPHMWKADQHWSSRFTNLRGSACAHSRATRARISGSRSSSRGKGAKHKEHATDPLGHESTILDHI